jgi:hypothetical protein
MPDRPAAFDALIRDAEAAATEQTDPLAVLVMLMRTVIRSDAEPYQLNGALIEGIATTIMQRIPAERREAGDARSTRSPAGERSHLRKRRTASPPASDVRTPGELRTPAEPRGVAKRKVSV